MSSVHHVAAVVVRMYPAQRHDPHAVPGEFNLPAADKADDAGLGRRNSATCSSHRRRTPMMDDRQTNGSLPALSPCRQEPGPDHRGPMPFKSMSKV